MFAYEKPKQRCGPQAGPVVQMVRKRVKGNGETVSVGDIFYDKNDGNYYQGMTQEAEFQNVEVASNENTEYLRVSEQVREGKAILLAKTVGAQFIRYEKGDAEQAAAEGSLWLRARPVTGGERMDNPPKAIRLYAEGDMTHAGSLAQSLNTAEDFMRFWGIGEPERNAGGASAGQESAEESGEASAGQESAEESPEPEILIKATEFDSKEGVVRRYQYQVPEFNAEYLQRFSEDSIKDSGVESRAELLTRLAELQFRKQALFAFRKGADDKRSRGNRKMSVPTKYRLFYDEGKQHGYVDASAKVQQKIAGNIAPERLEAAFGTGQAGTVGDLARPGRQRSRRRYDIIQATFFWLPHGDNSQNFGALKSFMQNQRQKLQQGGKIRITLINKNDSKLTDKNGYSTVAGLLRDDHDLNEQFDITVTPLGQTYSAALDGRHLNPRGFKHTRTDTSDEVTSEGDLMITATIRPDAQQ